MIIDSHVHAWSTDTPLASGRDYTPTAAAPVERLLTEMDRHRVDGAVLVQPSFLGTDNSYLIEAIRRYPDRLRGVAVVGPSAASPLLEDLRASGVAGLRFNLTHGQVPDFDSPAMSGLIERAATADLHIQLHADAPQLTGVLPPLLAAGCRLVIDHFGRPDPDGGADDPAWRQVLDLGRSENHRVKLSAPYRLRGVAAASLAPGLLAAFGSGALVWGSDFPWTRFEAGRSYGGCLEAATDWVPDTAQRRRILGATAAALYGFPNGR